MYSSSKEPGKYLLIAFGWMWLLNLPRVLAFFNVISIPDWLSAILGYTAVFGPAIAAFLLTQARAGKEGTRKLWGKGWRIDFNRRWLVPAGLLMPVSGGVTVLILVILRKPIFWEYSLPPAMIVPIGLVIWLLGAYPEEFGWRGFALPRLLEQHNQLASSLILGVVWAAWHLPLFYIEGTTQTAIPFWQYMLQLLQLSVIYTWLYEGTGGSVFAASLFHASGNLTGALLPYWVTNTGRWVSFVILLIPVFFIIYNWLQKGTSTVDYQTE